jgi:hypothetical protein
VLVLTATHGNLATNALRRLLQERKPLHRRVLVTDARAELPLGERGREYLAELRQAEGLGLVEVKLGEAEYIELESLQRVVQQARSGDLELPGGRSVMPAEVVAAHRRASRYQSNRLLAELMGTSTRLTLIRPEPVAP